MGMNPSHKMGRISREPLLRKLSPRFQKYFVFFLASTNWRTFIWKFPETGNWKVVFYSPDKENLILKKINSSRMHITFRFLFIDNGCLSHTPSPLFIKKFLLLKAYKLQIKTNFMNLIRHQKHLYYRFSYLNENK